MGNVGEKTPLITDLFIKNNYFQRVRMSYFILLTLVLFGCTLSAEQERVLSEAQRAYIDARNNADVLRFVGFTHPNVVAYYKNDADSSFQKKFDLSMDNYNIQDGTIRMIKKEGKTIHIDYLFKTLEKDNFDVFGQEIHIIAISEDHGDSWFFLDETDYRNEQIIAPKYQLIDTNE